MTDFDRFKVMKAKKMRNRIIKTEVKKLQRAALLKASPKKAAVAKAAIAAAAAAKAKDCGMSYKKYKEREMQSFPLITHRAVPVPAHPFWLRSWRGKRW